MHLSVKLSYYFASFHHLGLRIDVCAHISFTCVLNNIRNKTEMAINHREGRVGGENKAPGERQAAALKGDEIIQRTAEINISQTLSVLFFSSNSHTLSDFSSFSSIQIHQRGSAITLVLVPYFFHSLPLICQRDGRHNATKS